MAIQFKKNQVKCDIGSYIHYWRGLKKSGKTTLFYNLIKAQYGNLDKGLLISIGDEIGYQALDGLVYIEAPTWESLVEIFDDLVENKEDNDFELLGLDTVDEMVKLAQAEVKRLHKKAKGTSVEFNACFGGYGAPRKKVEELIDEQLARLRRAGYGLIYIGHTRIRDVKEKNGDEYQQLTSNLSADYDGIFSNKADIVMTISIEKNIDENKHVDGTTRYMYFRSDGFVDAGGRFAEMPERVEYGADNYIKAFEKGVKGAIVEEITDTEIKKKKEKEIKERKEKAVKYAKDIKENPIDEDRNADLIEEIKTAYKAIEEEDKKNTIKAMMQELGASKFSELADKPTKALEAILAAM